MKKYVKFLAVTIILILNIEISNSYAKGMTGYIGVNITIEIELLNSNSKNELVVYNSRQIYDNRNKEPYSQNIDIYRKNKFEVINNNIYKCIEHSNLYCYETPLIVIKDNNGNERNYSALIFDNKENLSLSEYFEYLEIVSKNDIPIYIQINCEDGTFKNLTDVKKIKKYKIIKSVKEDIRKIFPVSIIIILLFTLMLFVIKIRRKNRCQEVITKL